ncbi:hypothetical protein [Geminicoccus roseus]|uniref:hypothetical protein n=1 Tax=Geminicoccus roseus TaxID=404900 RepID=UPI0004125D55|nr:hypothetical protein [Geminicoccus roseus]
MAKPPPRPPASRRGASTLEYGLVAVLATVAVVGTLSTFGDQLRAELAKLMGTAIAAPAEPRPPG